MMVGYNLHCFDDIYCIIDCYYIFANSQVSFGDITEVVNCIS